MKTWETVKSENPEVRLLDGHLVDVLGTLIQGGTLNKNLYDAMLKAHDKGEVIYIYTSDPVNMLPLLWKSRVDTDKFEVISKELFYNAYNKRTLADIYGSEKGQTMNLYTIVTGQIIDDDNPKRLDIITTDENAWGKPEQSSYSFTRTEMPKELADYYHDNLLKRLNLIKELHKQGNVPYIPDIDKITPRQKSR